MHTCARGAIARLGEALVLRSPVRLLDPEGAESPVPLAPAPEVGAHTDAALAEAGFSPHEIGALREAGVV